MRRSPVLVLAAIICLLVVGCSENLVVEVRSNTEWSGSFGNRTVDGTGDNDVDVPDDRPQAAVVQKQTKGGKLTARMVCKNGGLNRIFGARDVEDEATTTAEYGVVSVCSDAE